MADRWIDRALMGFIRKLAEPVPLRVEVGLSSVASGAGTPDSPIIRLKDRRALISLALNPAINFGELYSQGRLEIEGDLVQQLESLYHARRGALARKASRWFGWTQ